MSTSFPSIRHENLLGQGPPRLPSSFFCRSADLLTSWDRRARKKQMSFLSLHLRPFHLLSMSLLEMKWGRTRGCGTRPLGGGCVRVRACVCVCDVYLHWKVTFLSCLVTQQIQHLLFLWLWTQKQGTCPSLRNPPCSFTHMYQHVYTTAPRQGGPGPWADLASGPRSPDRIPSTNGSAMVDREWLCRLPSQQFWLWLRFTRSLTNSHAPLSWCGWTWVALSRIKHCIRCICIQIFTLFKNIPNSQNSWSSTNCF